MRSASEGLRRTTIIRCADRDGAALAVDEPAPRSRAALELTGRAGALAAPGREQRRHDRQRPATLNTRLSGLG